MPAKVDPPLTGIEDLIGELTPGTSGWIKIDANGDPLGPATLLPPPPGPDIFAVPVQAPPVVPPGHDPLLTLSGAPLTFHMNSAVDNRMVFVYPAAKST